MRCRAALAVSLSAAALAACSGAGLAPPGPQVPAGAAPAQIVRDAAVTEPGSYAGSFGVPNVAGTYRGTVAITRGGRTETGTLSIVIAQSGSSISGSNTVEVPTLKTKGTESGSVVRSSGAVTATIVFEDHHDLGTGTADATIVGAEISASDVRFAVDGRPTGTVSFHVKKT